MKEIPLDNKSLIEPIKSPYTEDNGFIIGIPSLSPVDRVTENFARFTMIRHSLKIKEKIREILKKIGVCPPDYDSYIEKYFEIYEEEEDDDEEEEEKEDDDDEEEDDEEEEEEDDEEETDEAIEENGPKMMKDEDKKIFKELTIIFKEYKQISGKAFDDFAFYCSVIEKLYRDYKKNYWKNGIGKIYDKITKEIITSLNKNYLIYEKKFMFEINKLNNINSKLRNF